MYNFNQFIIIIIINLLYPFHQKIYYFNFIQLLCLFNLINLNIIIHIKFIIILFIIQFNLYY